jgi:hypothetical protein
MMMRGLLGLVLFFLLPEHRRGWGVYHCGEACDGFVFSFVFFFSFGFLLWLHGLPNDTMTGRMPITFCGVCLFVCVWQQQAMIIFLAALGGEKVRGRGRQICLSEREMGRGQRKKEKRGERKAE